MKKILIVEDTEANMYLIGFILKKSGYEVLEAKTGDEGVGLAIKEKPDMVLIDIQLPGIDGLEATRRIRKSGVGGDIPIIAITSFAMVGDRETALEAGCTAYIEKPLDPETFMSEIEKYFK